jgi:hypothetical protein
MAGPFMRYVIRPLSLSIIVMALLLGMLSVITVVTLDNRWWLLAILLFIVVLEAVYTTNWLRHPDRMPLDRSAYRWAELLIIFVVVRLISFFVFEDGLPNSDQLQEYLFNPLRLFFNGPFFVSLLLTVIGWRLAVTMSKIFSDLEVSEIELRYFALPLALRKALSEDQPIVTGRSHSVTSFNLFWVWGGVILAVAIGLSTLDAVSFDTIQNPLALGGLTLSPYQLLILLTYFGLGFWLLSQAKLMEMNARLLVNGIEKDDELDRKWQGITLLVLLGIGLAAAFLPTGPTVTISRILGVIIQAILFIGQWVIFLLFLPLALILSLFSNRSVEELQPLPPLIPEAPPEAPPPETSAIGETIMMVMSSAFWSIFVVIFILAILYFFRERKSTLRGKSPASIWQQMKVWLRDLWRRLLEGARTIRIQIPVRFSGEPEAEETQGGRRRWRFLRLGGLSPREQIRYFYLSTVRRAGERGVERESAETPLEFVADLKEGWPEVEQEVEDLTDAFLKARYSQNPITSSDVPEIKNNWKEVRREIRNNPTADADDGSEGETEEGSP